MIINEQIVDKVATLAKLSFNKEDKANLIQDMNKILVYIDKLNELNTDEVAPLIFMSEEINPFREDIPQEVLTKEEALKNALQKNSDYIKVPKFLDR